MSIYQTIVVVYCSDLVQFGGFTTPRPFFYAGSDFINAVVCILSTGFFPVSWVVFIAPSDTGWPREPFHLKYRTVAGGEARLVCICLS